MNFQSSLLGRLPIYPMGRIAAVKKRLVAEGRDVIDLGAGDADFPPPQVAIEALAEAVGDPLMSRYAFQVGLTEFREAAARYMQRRFGVTVDPVTEILPLIGSKEGLAHLPQAVMDPGDVCVIPEPGYPPYLGGAVLAGSDPEIVPLRPENGFLLELDSVPAERLKRTRLVFLNYPNNPTTAVAPRDYLERTVATCLELNTALAYDNPYCELTFDGYRAPSVLQFPGARKVAVEFHSLSKSFAMTGWRIAWVAGNADIIAALARVKNFVDTGAFLAVQRAAAVVLDSAEEIIPGIRDRIRERRDAGVEALNQTGFQVKPPQATMYLWVPLPAGTASTAFAERALEDEALALVAGSAFGPAGEGFVRLALTVNPDRLRDAAGRMARVLERVGVVAGA